MELLFSILFIIIFSISSLFLFLSFIKKDYNFYLVKSNIELFSYSSVLLLLCFFSSKIIKFDNVWLLSSLFSLWFFLTKLTVYFIN